MSHLNNFFGINIANSPVNLITTGWGDKDFLLIIGALLIPIVSYGSQVLNIKLMPNAANAAGGDNDAMAKHHITIGIYLPIPFNSLTYVLPVLYIIAPAVKNNIFFATA